MTWMPLKDYQQETLDHLGAYCREIRSQMARGAAKPQRDAFELLTERGYYSPPGFDHVPYICLRLPTGGGKTLLAAHAVGTVGRELLGTDRPVCLWITPSTTIRDQTLRGLLSIHHPYRKALEDSLGASVEVVTLEQALTTPRAVQSEAALVIVTTIQSYRIREDEGGEELAATRRIYRDNGYLQTAFENLPEWAKAELARDEKGNVDLSLANALKLRRPIVVMDEAHNARTPISFESLARFGPSMVLELTATPEQRHDPNQPTDPRYASNVLHAVSALELQQEGMIKLPVDLESRNDWLEVLRATVQRREELEKIADRATQEPGLPFIRPIALIQAQASSKTKETHTVEKVKAALIENLQVPADYIRICTGSLDEIGETDLMETNCPVRYVITVDKLREGWDCPLAYVLGSIGNAATATAVEQLIGRVLRMPFANPTRVPALDRAYAFVLSDNVVKTAMQLRDRMVENCGFDERSAKDALRVVSTATQRGLGLSQIPLSEPPQSNQIPAAISQKVRYDTTTKALVVESPLNRNEVRALQEALPIAADREAVEAYWERERPVGIAAKKLDEFAKPFRIPRLVVRDGDRLTLLEPEELDEFQWALDVCDPALTETEFSTDLHTAGAVELGLDKEALVTKSVGDARYVQLELIGEGDDWEPIELTRWLDQELHRGDAFLGLPKSESQPWLQRVVDGLAAARKGGLPVIVRRRHKLASALRAKIADHGRKQVRKAIEWLIDKSPNSVEASQEFSILLEEHDYKPSSLFTGGHTFKKQPFALIGAMNGEETECASKIDQHSNVARWIRNPDHANHGGFWLPKSPGRFFPDFIVEMLDGTLVLVEYKMEKMSRDLEEIHKRAVGELWERRSGGKCRFGWVVNKDWEALGRVLEAKQG